MDRVIAMMNTTYIQTSQLPNQTTQPIPNYSKTKTKPKQLPNNPFDAQLKTALTNAKVKQKALK